jgi:hypothetical protein
MGSLDIFHGPTAVTVCRVGYRLLLLLQSLAVGHHYGIVLNVK